LQALDRSAHLHQIDWLISSSFSGDQDQCGLFADGS
jgi:hypothetical protein